MPSNHLILCHPLLLLLLIVPSIKIFSSESALCIRWPKNWSFSIIPSSEHPGLVSFRMDWLGLLAVQGTLNGLQHHNLNVSLLWCSAFFMVQVSHPYMTTGKIPLTIWTFVGKVMSLLFIGVWYIKHRSWLKKKKRLRRKNCLNTSFCCSKHSGRLDRTEYNPTSIS